MSGHKLVRGKGPLGVTTHIAIRERSQPNHKLIHQQLTDQKKFQLKYELKFEFRKKDKQPVLAKWSNGIRATWGETGKSRFYYEKGDVFLTTFMTWKWLYRLYEEAGLPLDPDPVTTVDIAFALADPPKEIEYLHGYRILNIDSKHRLVTVAPVVRVPYDAIMFSMETVSSSKKPEFKLLQLGGAAQVWNKAKLDARLISTGLERQMNELGEAIQFTVQATVLTLDLATGGMRTAASAAAKKYFLKKFKNLGMLLKVMATLDKPIGKGLISFASTLAKELAKVQLIQSHFNANKQMETGGPIVIVPVYKNNDPSFAIVVQKAVGAFAVTFVAECLGEVFSKKFANDEFLRRRVKYTLDGDLTEDFITAPFRKAVNESMYKLCITDRVTDVITIINEALMKSKDGNEFQDNLRAEFKTQFAKAIEDALKSAVQLLGS